MMIRTRFAPSPTGFLHIGGARTALFNYLFARHNNGKFLLRIEDTDKKRSTQEATDAIFNSLQWLDINWDEEVVFQSMRNDRHYLAALTLIERNKAYYCFSSQEEIESVRNAAISSSEHFIFKSPWRDAKPATYPKNIKPVIRLKADRTGSTLIQDELLGTVTIENDHLDDMVLVRADGTATYMLAVVVDDHDMRITHIIRGDDHLTNAARQIQLYKAFDWPIPSMVHIPLIHGPDGAKLSKRHGALGVDAYRDMGYLPEALCNYLLRLGWAHGNDEIISRNEAVKLFDIKGLGVSPARLDFAKMNHINAHYLRNTDNKALVEMILNDLSKEQEMNDIEKEYIVKAIDSIKVRAELLTELVELAKIYLPTYNIDYSKDAINIIDKSNKSHIQQVIDVLSTLANPTKEIIQLHLKEIAVINNLKFGELMQTIRVLMTGSTNSPSIFELIEIIGVKNSIKRLNKVFTNDLVFK